MLFAFFCDKNWELSNFIIHYTICKYTRYSMDETVTLKRLNIKKFMKDN